MIELYFLIAIAVLWLAFAGIHDLKTRMVPNWVSLSLVVFALGYRLFYSFFSQQGFGFFYQGIIGLGIFFVIGNLLYYGRMFAAGDAKLMIALGTVLPFSQSLGTNIIVYALFVFLFLVAGGFYGLLWSFFLAFGNFKKFKAESKKIFHENRVIVYSFLLLALVFLVLSSKYYPFSLYLAILSFIFPYLYIYAKSVDNSCLVREKPAESLEEGDWLYRDLRIGSKTIKANWHGLTKTDISRIKKSHKKIKIREGIAFAPVFLISFLLLVYIYFFSFEYAVRIFGSLSL